MKNLIIIIFILFSINSFSQSIMIGESKSDILKKYPTAKYINITKPLLKYENDGIISVYYLANDTCNREIRLFNTSWMPSLVSEINAMDEAVKITTTSWYLFFGYMNFKLELTIEENVLIMEIIKV